MNILAIDLGKFKSVACEYDSTNGEHTFVTVPTRPADFHDLLTIGVHHTPERLVIEIGSAAGWVSDMARSLEIEVQVANPNHEAWRWKSVKRKTDKDDALKLAQLSAMNQLPTVTLPKPGVRQWRSLIAFRQTLVGRRTAIKNNIRSILDRQGLTHASGRAGWSASSIASLGALSQPLDEVRVEELWRGQLHTELEALAQLMPLIERVEAKLDALAQAHARVELLRTIPGVGPRLSEMVVAMIDDPKRFTNAKQLGAYAGLVPRQIESGTMSRTGRITGRGNKLLRALLVEVAWLMRQHNRHLRATLDRVCRGSKTRRKVAVVATARKLLVICWVMMRDGTPWREPTPPLVT